MEIKTKFNLGQRVWRVEDLYTRTTGVCKVCNDTKVVNIKGQDFVCPNCANNNHVKHFHRKYVSNDACIGNVRVELYEHNGNETYRESRDRKDVYQYMLYDTGIGSGSLWDEEKLFASKEEAQTYCDQVNEQRIKEEQGLEVRP